ncbi:MAG: Hsp70 family protein [Phycisphaerae bacterium]|jgi:molecular chaperone DnaK|nr:Hsp70 family protein [Phycisphaerae bacterium]
MGTKDVLAIDFGTSNTYYCRCPGDQLSPKGVDFGDGRDGLASAILYRDSRSSLIGHVALEEYGESTPAERRSCKLRTRFKPDIATSDEARTAAQDFLAAVLSEARSQRVDLVPDGREVIFGVPSEADEAFRRSLATLAEDAGYGKVSMIDEPRGALLYHVFHKDIPARDALKGLLAIDFGGGTCDFAFMCRGVVQHSWGDMHLGGRLFDDLFFQWFVDCNPDAVEKMREDGCEYFVHSFLCREVKEAFSRTMARDRKEAVTKTVRHYGRLAGITWKEFAERAKVYRPTNHVMEYTAIAANGQIDLVSWFRRCLCDGLRAKGIDRSDIKFVILSGGSSQWPFVVDTVVEELGIDESRIRRSDRPYAAISEGLSIVPALRRQFSHAQENLRANLPTFVSKKLDPLVKKRVDEVAKAVATAVTGELFDQKLRPILVQFRDKGGTVASLKKQIASATSAFEPRLLGIIEEKMTVLSRALPADVTEAVGAWFDEYGLAAPSGSLELSRSSTNNVAVSVEMPDFYSDIFNTVASFSTGIIASVVAMICGGGGMALIASGPLGWIIGAIIGLVVGALVMFYGAEAAKDMAEGWEVPGWIRRRAVTDKKVKETRSKLADDIQSTIEGEFEPMKQALDKQVRLQVEAEIDAINEINQM